MSALEIMDPKMDAGMQNDNDVTLESALGTALMPLDLSVRQVIYVMDQQVVQEMIWLNGHALAQCIFTCLYLHEEAKHVRDRALLAVRPPSTRAPTPHGTGAARPAGA